MSPKNFAEQLAFLRSQYNVMSLKTLLGEIKKGNLPQRGIVITFDDGYADNYWNAKPLLEKYKLPATVCVASELIDTVGFWWDELARAVLQTAEISKRLQIRLPDRSYEYPVENFAQRQQAYFTLHSLLKPLKASERDQVLKEFFVLNGMIQRKHTNDRPLTTEELIQLSQSELIEIGAHTATHAFLPTLSRADQVEEIDCSRQKLKAILGMSIDSFSFPYGNFTAKAVDIVKEAGFKAALTCQRSVIERGSNLFTLGRFEVGDWGTEEFEKNVRKFFSN